MSLFAKASATRPAAAGVGKRAGANAALAGILSSFLALAMTACATPVIPIATTPDLSKIADGSYEGYYDAQLVKARVLVEVSGGRMTKVDIVSHDCSPIGKPAAKIAELVVAAQSLEVDVVSGATGSSRTILKAIENALSKGIKG